MSSEVETRHFLSMMGARRDNSQLTGVEHNKYLKVKAKYRDYELAALKGEGIDKKGKG